MSRESSQGDRGGGQHSQRGHQGGQGPQQPPAGGQPPQGGQQPQNGPQQGGRQPRSGPPQGGPPPQQGAAGGGGIDTDFVKQIAIWGVVAFAVAGIAFGLMPLLLGTFGEDATTTVTANATAAEQQAEDTEQANQIISDALSDENASAAAAYETKTYQNSIIRSVIGLAPYLAFIAAAFVGLLLGLRSSADERTLIAGVAVASVVGVLLFVVLSTGVAAFQYNGMSEDDWKEEYNTDPADWGYNEYPRSDVDENVIEQLNEEDLSPSDASIPTVGTIQALSISYGTLLMNSVLVGIMAAIGGAGMAVAGRRIDDNLP